MNLKKLTEPSGHVGLTNKDNRYPLSWLPISSISEVEIRGRAVESVYLGQRLGVANRCVTHVQGM